MKLRFAFVLVAILAFSMVAGSALAAPAGPTGVEHHSGKLIEPVGATGSALYIVQLSDPPLASYYGGVESFAPTSPAVTGERKLNMDSAASVAYMDYLDGVQAAMLNTIDQTLGRDVYVHAQWNVAYNGFAIEMTPEEAATVVGLEGINIVQREFMRYPQTDVGPQWIGADNIWNGSATGTLYKGEGVVAGIIDTGINLGHPSFAATGQDGYVHTNPLGSGNYLGLCLSNPGTYVCNDKTYGFYIFTGEVSEDGDGHGSHTGSTTAGNYLQPGTVDLSPFNTYSPAISGVAPHANIIGYKACLDAGGCPGAALVSSINQATADGVDVINYSIGGGTSNPWTDADALAFLAAQDAGVVPVTSAGNNGPGASTVGSPGDAPWMMTVGASTHNRAGINAIIDMTGGDTTPPPDLEGKGFSLGTGMLPMVYAGDFGDALCLNEFAPGTFTGQIVVCDRGTNARVAKGYNVLQGGAGGMVLVNTDPGQSLNGDVHWLPAVQLDSVKGTALKTWMASGSGHMGKIEGTNISFDPANGDIMAGFSSRGPLVNNASDIIKPDVTAPGVDIIAAYRDLPPGPEDPTQNYGVVSGTSMSSPHTAGAAALLSGLYPDWTPAEVKAAMMSTGKVAGVYKEDYVTQADPFDMGGGRVQVDQGAQSGLLFNVAPGAFQAANPGSGGDPKTLNLASLGNDDCGSSCSWTRTVEAVDDGTWTVSASAPAGMTLTVVPNSFSLNAGQTQVLNITANVAGLPVGTWAFGQVNLTPGQLEGGGFAAQHLPVAVKPSSSTPIIDVTPGSLSSTQAPNTSNVEPLNVGNTGTADLTWNIFEDNATVPELLNWSENFDSYATGSQLIGQGGWDGWGASPTAGALTSSAQARSAPNSAAIEVDSDLVHEYSGYTSGGWLYAAWQYVPSDFTGESYFILLNEYTSAGGGDGNWSAQVHFNGATNQVLADGVGAAFPPLTLVKGQWVELRVEIDLDADTQTFYYDNQVLYTGSWSDGVSGGGSINIAAVDLFANGASVIYYDDMVLEPFAVTCSAPDDIPWASVSPAAGTTTPGNSTAVNVTFDSTGLSPNTYTGTLCVESNDPVTPLVQVPLELVVTTGGPPNIDVNPLSLDSTQGTNTTTNQPLTIANTGGGTLDWMIEEEDTTAPPFGNGNTTLDPTSASENASDAPAGAPVTVPEGVTIWRAPDVVLWDNGPLVNSPGTGVGGADESVLQSVSLGMTTLGFGHQVLNNNWVADDFTVADAGGWTVDSATFFAYQTGSSTTSTMTNVNWVIYDGDPSAGGTAIFNGSGLSATAWSNIYRVTETTTGTATDRPIMADTTPVGVFLPQGTYWIAWQTAGTLGSGPWAPPITTNGQTTTGNGQQSLAGGAFAAALDTGSLTQQGFPFILEGTVGGSAQPCSAVVDISWLSLNTTAGSNAGGTNTPVTVTFDSTGLANGVYTGNLCVTSNDPDPGPGNGTDLVVVPVTLTVRPPTAVALTDLAAGVEQMPAPLSGLPLATLPAAAAAALGAAFVWRRNRD
ncbi:MAG: S8 family serine peptidase [Anaerolineae bacterium]|nr:S8 family serine peptidase [Anaerolineae bacterium]